jgi:hypothetical protein
MPCRAGLPFLWLTTVFGGFSGTLDDVVDPAAQVRRIAWTNASNVAEICAFEPCVVLGSPADVWPARAWTAASLAARIPWLNAAFASDIPFFRYFTGDAPLAAAVAVAAAAPQTSSSGGDELKRGHAAAAAAAQEADAYRPPYDVVGLRTDDFFAACASTAATTGGLSREGASPRASAARDSAGRRPPHRYYYYTGLLRDGANAVVADVHPWEPFVVHPHLETEASADSAVSARPFRRATSVTVFFLPAVPTAARRPRTTMPKGRWQWIPLCCASHLCCAVRATTQVRTPARPKAFLL